MEDKIIKSRRFERYSFDGLVLAPPGQFLFCAFTDCTFRKASLRTNLDGQFLRCLFEESDLCDALLRGRFQECMFRDCDFSRSRASQMEFSDCTFARAKFHKVVFHEISFRRCYFESCLFFKGEIGRSHFLDCTAQETVAKGVHSENTEWPGGDGFVIRA